MSWQPIETAPRDGTPAISSLLKALEAIASQAVCYGMKADENELRDWLRFISETADAALSGEKL